MSSGLILINVLRITQQSVCFMYVCDRSDYIICYLKAHKVNGKKMLQKKETASLELSGG